MKYLNLSNLLGGAVLVFIGTILSSGSKIVERVIVGRTLGPEAYGQVSIALSIFTIASYIALAGFQDGVSRFIPRYNDSEDIRGIWATGVVVTTTLSIILAFTLLFSADYLTDIFYGGQQDTLVIALMIVALPAFVLQLVGVGTFRGLGDARTRLLTYDIFFPFVRIGLLVGLLALGVQILSLPIAYVGACIVGVAAIHIPLHRSIGLTGAKKFRFKEMARFSAPLIVAAVASRLLTRTDTLMIGYLSSARQAGIYEAAYPIANGLVLVLTALGFLYLPLVSRLDSEKDMDGVARAYQITTKWAYIITLPMFSTLILVPEFLVTRIFSPEYAAAAPVLVVLATGFFANTAFGRSRETLSALGYTTRLMIVNSLAFFVNVGLNWILIPQYGELGAAVASAATFVLLNAAIVMVLYAKTGVTPYSLATVKTIILLPLMTLPVAGGIRYLFGPNLISLLLIPIVVTGVSLLVLVLSGALEQEDMIVVDLIESKTGVTIPYVRGFVEPEQKIN